MLGEAQAKVLAEAFGKADIKIVGGDGQFLDKFVQAASVGNMVDGFLANFERRAGGAGALPVGEPHARRRAARRARRGEQQRGRRGGRPRDARGEVAGCGRICAGSRSGPTGSRSGPT
ncbi:MAG: hypothetical protein R3F59_21965 [Myxococcota bacterium]